MEKVNIIKVMEKEKSINDIGRRSLGKESYMQSVEDYLDDYIVPLLNERKDINFDTTSRDEEICQETQIIYIALSSYLNKKGLSDEKINNYDLSLSEVFNLEDKKLKAEITNEIFKTIIDNLQSIIKEYFDYIEEIDNLFS